MLISIIIPVYNMASYLDRCLSSVLNQTYKKLEIIIIDDCSTDNSYEIIDNFQKQDIRIKVFQNEKNSLIGVSRNLGIREAKGDYIWFVDADDWIEINALEIIVAKLNEDRTTDVILLGYLEHHAQSRSKEKRPSEIVNSDNALTYYLQLRKGLCPMALAYVYSREMLSRNKILFTENVYFEDVAFSAKITHQTKNLKVIPIALYNYNKENQGSITQTQSKKKIKDLLTAYEGIKDYMNQEGILVKYQNLLTIRFLAFGLSRCFKMYLMLPKSEQKDGYFERELFYYRKSVLMAQKTLNGLIGMSQSFGQEEADLKREYKANLEFLWWVKNAFGPLKFINLLNRKWHVIKAVIA